LFLTSNCSDKRAASGVIPGTIRVKESGFEGITGLKEVIISVSLSDEKKKKAKQESHFL
jgi:hypothetical protein